MLTNTSSGQFIRLSDSRPGMAEDTKEDNILEISDLILGGFFPPVQKNYKNLDDHGNNVALMRTE